MSHSKKALFTLEGRFLGFVDSHEVQPRLVRLATAEGEFFVKLSKEVRSSLVVRLEAGEWLKMSGEMKLDYKTNKLKLKAYQLQRTVATPSIEAKQSPAAASGKSKACVMVCQKSDCRKRGADAVCQALATSLQAKGLDDQVTVKGTGCMKQCKRGANAIFMPDKTRYTQVSPKDIPALIEKHFANMKEAAVPIV